MAPTTNTPRDSSVVRRQIELLDTAHGYFGSQVLFTANELGVFGELADGPRTANRLAQSLEADEDALERLLNACVALELLALDGGVYANTPLADQVLVPDREGYLGNWLRLMSRWMSAWTDLTETVRTGRPAHDSQLHLGGDPEQTREFLLGMDDYARLRGSEIVRYLDFGGGLELIDVGGGPGSYAILFAKTWPDLNVTVFDLPGVIPIAQKHAEEAGVGDRVSVTPGNYYEDEFGSGYDVVFLSDTLHQESPEVCELILQKAQRALRPGGRIVVQAMFLNEDRVSPRWPVMHSLIMILIYGGGRAYTVQETAELMEQAGFVECEHQRMSLLNVNSLITARKP
jgi:2-polyprenyl-3-methyl-5-hydroxy-6-metoxy-1,4-benzoquinol methylase